MGDWTTFWFEGNMRFAMIKNLKDWANVVKAYRGHLFPAPLLLEKAKNAPHRADGLPPKFGFDNECSGNLTLEAWAKKNGMYDDMAAVL